MTRHFWIPACAGMTRENDSCRESDEKTTPFFVDFIVVTVIFPGFIYAIGLLAAHGLNPIEHTVMAAIVAKGEAGVGEIGIAEIAVAIPVKAQPGVIG